MARVARVAERDERVPAEPAGVVARDEEAVVLLDQRAAVGLEPGPQVDVSGIGRRSVVAALLDAAVPRADVLTDVAAVDLCSELLAVLHGNGVRRLRPVREAARGVERSGLVERAGRAGVDAEAAVAAVGVERRRRGELEVGDERAQHHPGAMAAGDQQRVLAVEPHAAPRGGSAVDVLVRVDEDAVASAQPLAELSELPAELGVGIVPGVARKPPVPRLQRRFGLPVAERGRDDASRTGHQRLRMA